MKCREISYIYYRQKLTAYLLNNMETVVIILPQDIRTHEGEDRHDIEKDAIRIYSGNSSHKQQRRIMCLRVIGDSYALNNQVNPQCSFIDVPAVFLLDTNDVNFLSLERPFRHLYEP